MKLRNLTNGEFYLISLSAIVLNGLDLIITLISLSLFGAIELNPFYSTFNAYNMSYKLFSITAYIIVLNVLFNKVKTLKLTSQLMLLTITFIYVGVLLNNLIVILT